MNQNPLFRIDPTEGLVQYFNDIKPYHSKVLDVLIEYVYTEKLKAVLRDKHLLTLGLPVIDEVDPNRTSSILPQYAQGYGSIWDNPYDPNNLLTPPPVYQIISAQSSIEVPAVVSGSTITYVPDPSQYAFGINSTVIFNTTGSFPLTVPPLVGGETLFVITSVGNAIQVSRTIGGAPIVFTSPGTGILSVIATNIPINSFTVQLSIPPSDSAAVVDLKSNQFAFTYANNITNVSTVGNSWSISGDVTPLVTSGDTIYVNGNTNGNANKSYTVVGVTFNVGPNTTTIAVQQPIPLIVTNTGLLHIIRTGINIPTYVVGSAIRFSSTGTLPYPLTAGTTYYIAAISPTGKFNITTTRFSTEYGDIVNIATLGVGDLSVSLAEPLITGEQISVSGSHFGQNDGKYRVSLIDDIGGGLFRVHVHPQVRATTPISAATDGTITKAGNYGSPGGALVAAPPLYTSTTFNEVLELLFSGTISPYLLDTFSGNGSLGTHTVDSGHLWNIIQLTDDLTELVLNNGQLSTTDTDIWVQSNWVPPPSPITFKVEADVFVGAVPTSGSPYFRLFAKESSSLTFYGPMVDVFPNPTTNKIAVRTMTADGTTNAVNVTDTIVDVGQVCTVTLTVTNQTTVKVEVNGVVIYNSPTVTWPVLSRVGFNFNNPQGTATQFSLQRLLATI